jgi:hypothetical protein
MVADFHSVKCELGSHEAAPKLLNGKCPKTEAFRVSANTTRFAGLRHYTLHLSHSAAAAGGMALTEEAGSDSHKYSGNHVRVVKGQNW